MARLTKVGVGDPFEHAEVVVLCFDNKLSLELTMPSTVPPGRASLHLYPGTSCLATIVGYVILALRVAENPSETARSAKCQFPLKSSRPALGMLLTPEFLIHSSPDDIHIGWRDQVRNCPAINVVFRHCRFGKRL
jgi:hypothetical protein